jgi:hypothetical protein
MSALSEFFKIRPFAGIGLIAIPILIFIILMNSYSPKSIPEGYSSFILAFEFAKTPEQINTLFTDIQEETYKIIDTGIYIDFGFMIAYSIFLALFFYKSTVVSQMKWLMAGIPLSVVILSGDFFENMLLLQISDMYRTGLNLTAIEPLLLKLHLITWIKWGGLSVSFLMISVYLFRGNRLSKTGAVICFSPFVLNLFALNNSPFNLSIYTLSVFASFTVIIFYSFLFRNQRL